MTTHELIRNFMFLGFGYGLLNGILWATDKENRDGAHLVTVPGTIGGFVVGVTCLILWLVGFGGNL